MLSALDLARRIEAGELTPRAVVELCAEAIAAREADIRAFVALDLDAARRAAGRSAPDVARRCAACRWRSRTFSTPPICRRNTARRSMPAIGRAPMPRPSRMTRRAGGIVIGKTVTTEMASLVPSVTRNPHNLAHTPGGSSSGSAAAVAAGMVPIAFGTQTAGSVIRPAAFCGVAGFKPSYRLIPTVGVKDVSWHLDTAGLFGAGVADVAFAAAAILGRDLRVDRAAPAAPRIALVRTHLWPQASAAMQKAVETAARIARSRRRESDRADAAADLGRGLRRAISPSRITRIFRALAFEYDRHREQIDAKAARAARSRRARSRPRNTMPRAAPRAARGRCSRTRWRITT